MKERFENLLETVDRPGVKELANFLVESDFYTAPCSTKFHLAKRGGLAEHTMNVVNCACSINGKYAADSCTEGLYPDDSVVLAALGHDLCKVNFYKEVHEDPTDSQMRYLTSLMGKAGLKVPTKGNKTYVGSLIDFMLKTYKKGMEIPVYDDSPTYVVDDQQPLGHGEKSLWVMQQFVQLTLDEALAVRWHMASFDAGIHFPYPSGYAYNEAVKKSKLVSIIILADMEASNLVEV